LKESGQIWEKKKKKERIGEEKSPSFYPLMQGNEIPKNLLLHKKGGRKKKGGGENRRRVNPLFDPA